MKNYNVSNYNERFFPAAPFLLGALTGGAAVSVFNPYRPRPYYPINQPYYGTPYGYGYGYYNYY